MKRGTRIKRTNQTNTTTAPEGVFSSGAVARKSVMQVKGAIHQNRELKFLDATTNLVVDTTGTIALLNGLGEGDDYSLRNGRQIKAMRISMRAYAIPTTTTGVPQLGRMMLVWDNATNGAAPLITDVLVSASATSFVNVNNQNRFTILYDHVYRLGAYSLTATQSIIDMPFVSLEADIGLNSDVQYLGTGATVASIQNGALWLLSVGLNAAGATAGAAQATTRFRFYDIA